ncbi:methionyl-tRNA formyltransferase [bacterium]|nr:methionyl-tRNA formyltransferase [bacterium]
MLRTVFMGTPGFAASSLAKLLEKGKTPVAVVCQPPRAVGRGLKTQPSEVQQLAEKSGLTVLPVENVNAPEVLAQLRDLKPDLILVAAFGQLLKKELLELPPLGCLNVHGSLLPKYRGAAPIQRAILNGEKETGVAVQRIVRKLDAGDILLTRRLPILPQDTSGTLFDRLAELGADALVEAVEMVESGRTQFTPQDEAQATHAAKLTKEEAVIDWSLPAEQIERQVRGYQPWPVAETRLGNDRLKIFGAELLPKAPAGKPGTITSDGKTFVHVACGGAAGIALTQIQLENRKKLETREFLMAYRGAFPFTHLG